MLGSGQLQVSSGHPENRNVPVPADMTITIQLLSLIPLLYHSSSHNISTPYAPFSDSTSSSPAAAQPLRWGLSTTITNRRYRMYGWDQTPPPKRNGEKEALSSLSARLLNPAAGACSRSLCRKGLGWGRLFNFLGDQNGEMVMVHNSCISGNNSTNSTQCWVFCAEYILRG